MSGMFDRTVFVGAQAIWTKIRAIDIGQLASRSFELVGRGAAYARSVFIYVKSALQTSLQFFRSWWPSGLVNRLWSLGRQMAGFIWSNPQNATYALMLANYFKGLICQNLAGFFYGKLADYTLQEERKKGRVLLQSLQQIVLPQALVQPVTGSARPDWPKQYTRLPDSALKTYFFLSTTTSTTTPNSIIDRQIFDISDDIGVVLQTVQELFRNEQQMQLEQQRLLQEHKTIDLPNIVQMMFMVSTIFV
jgi:hypothetical protein